jgi:bifunctional non-homologous end joining protein LigD
MMIETVTGAVQRPFPTALTPMLAETGQPFSHPDWLFELKWDGWRGLAFLDRDGRSRADRGTSGEPLRLTSRSGQSLLERFPELRRLADCVSASQCVLDGEIVALDENGRASLGLLQQRMQTRGDVSSPLCYYVFDLLYVDGWDMRGVPLLERKRLLRDLLRTDQTVLFSDHVENEGRLLFELARERGVEGIMAKRKSSTYSSGRSDQWQKIKFFQSTDCVIVGWTLSRQKRAHFGALVLAMYQNDDLVWVGNVGSGFNELSLKDIHAELQPLALPACPLREVPKIAEEVVWVQPERVCIVRYGDWTQTGVLRHPVFTALRRDKPARECCR